MWNKLNTTVIACCTVSTFTKYLDNYIFNRFIISQSGFLPLDHHVPWWTITIKSEFGKVFHNGIISDRFPIMSRVR